MDNESEHMDILKRGPMKLELIYFEDDVAENLMEAFRLYGSKTDMRIKKQVLVYFGGKLCC